MYGAYKFEVVCDITDRVSNTKMIPSYELQRNKMLLLTIQHYIEEVKPWIDDIFRQKHFACVFLLILERLYVPGEGAGYSSKSSAESL